MFPRLTLFIALCTLVARPVLAACVDYDCSQGGEADCPSGCSCNSSDGWCMPMAEPKKDSAHMWWSVAELVAVLVFHIYDGRAHARDSMASSASTVGSSDYILAGGDKLCEEAVIREFVQSGFSSLTI
ncbi:hypothetical protein DFP72DRAFT_856775 [Ephemerocybe angulata]|uniref:Uncharacterized protein n=1 Tax=Ephemerocybe angulata TaxID=980116 RepID=A0A8H6LWV3_9AGAR|nr:hypothetical protein DFP72DRAFT_856775 [Tulosesus angulatus]